MSNIKDLHDLCMTISEAVEDANKRIRSSGGKLSAGDVDYIDKLTHTLKSLKAVIKMESEDEEYSGDYPYSMEGSNRGSYARGRGSSARRDSMGRYSRDGYSRDGYSRGGDMVEELRELMKDATDERTRREFQQFISKIESM